MQIISEPSTKGTRSTRIQNKQEGARAPHMQRRSKRRGTPRAMKMRGDTCRSFLESIEDNLCLEERKTHSFEAGGIKKLRRVKYTTRVSDNDRCAFVSTRQGLT